MNEIILKLDAEPKDNYKRRKNCYLKRIKQFKY